MCASRRVPHRVPRIARSDLELFHHINTIIMAAVEPSDNEIGELFSVPNTDLHSAIIAELKSTLRIHNVSAEDLPSSGSRTASRWAARTHTWTSKRSRTSRRTSPRLWSARAGARSGSRPSGARSRPRALDWEGMSLTCMARYWYYVRMAYPGQARPKHTDFDREPSAHGELAEAEERVRDARLEGLENAPWEFSIGWNNAWGHGHAVSVHTNPSARLTVGRATAFADRKDSGAIVESLNDHIRVPPPDDTPPSEPRIKLKSNTEMAKFAYKTMSMKLSEASEFLDDRIEEFAAMIQEHHKLEDGAFGNPASMSPTEIIAVGRIASDSGEGRLNESSLVLEPSRRMSAGTRVPLRVGALPDFQLFPGKIVALKGINATGEFFSATAALAPPPLYAVSSDIAALDAGNARVSESGGGRPLVVLVASGPYTRDDDLDFAPLRALLAAAEAQHADALLLSGPFVDAEHPLVRAGDFDLPPTYPVEPDRATLADVFRAHVSAPLSALAASLPGCAVALCPSPRDAAARHVAWPQDRLAPRRGELALPRTASLVTDPMLLSLNEAHVALSTLDALQQMGATEAVSRGVRAGRGGAFLERLARQLLEQRHLFPLFPPADRQPAAGRRGG